MQYVQEITLDIFRLASYKTVEAKEGDRDARLVKVTLTANGQKIAPENGVSALMRCTKPDGHSVNNPGVINDDGTITITLTDQLLAVPGKVEADICLMLGDHVVSSASFIILVEKAPLSAEEVVSSYEFLTMVDATAAALVFKSHLDLTDNPHNVTADQVGAAPAVESTEYPGCYYRMVDGEQEWLNPPMTGGLEYRTTERSGGDPLYTKSIYCGVLIDQMQVDLPSSIIYRWHGWTSIGTVMGSYQANEAWSLTVQFLPNTKKVMFRLGSDAVAAGMVGYVQVWFKKK